MTTKPNELVAAQPRKFWMRWRVRIGYPVAVLYWLLAKPTHHWIAMGAAVAGFGILIRAIAAGHLSKDRELATAGPYARTRNPLYLGSAFLAAGFAIAGHSWWAGSLIVIYFAVFYYAVMRNEEQDLRAALAPSSTNTPPKCPSSCQISSARDTCNRPQPNLPNPSAGNSTAATANTKP